MRDFASGFGLRYRVYDSDTDEYEQLTQIERARTDGAAAIIICPLNAELLDVSLKSIQASTLPLVIMSNQMPSYGGVLVAGDDYQTGYKPGELAGRIISEEMGGQADVIILDYPDLQYIVQRANGLEDGVLSQAPEAHIVGRYRGAVPEFAEASINALLEDGVHFDVILSINDAGSFGAINALENAGIGPDDVLIASVDAEQLARRYIREGYFIRGSVDVGRELFARAAVDIVTMLLAGATVPENVLVPPGEVITAQSDGL
jgi:ABC-type sugar transport system substrate-binding protein